MLTPQPPLLPLPPPNPPDLPPDTLMAAFEEGTWVWMPDEEHIVVPAKVKATFSAGSPGNVTSEDGEDHSLSGDQTKALTVCEEQCLSSKVDNLITLNDLNESSILHNLRIRFKLDKIYTSVSSILISVNPFKQVS